MRYGSRRAFYVSRNLQRADESRIKREAVERADAERKLQETIERMKAKAPVGGTK